MTQGLASGMPKTLASQKRGAQSAAGIAGHRLYVDLFEATARLESANQENIQEQAARDA